MKGLGAARAAAARVGALGTRLVLDVGGRMGARPGERRFPGRPQPSGLELEAHAPYAPGDDLRHLDWNLLGRFDSLVMRRFTAEREVVVHLLVDASASMGVPPVDRKYGVAAELALALAAIALASRHAVRLVVLRGDAAPRTSAVHRRRTGLVAMADLLDATVPAGAFGLGGVLGEYGHRHAEGGASLVISDFLIDAEELETGVAALRRRGYAVTLLQVLGRGEVEPSRALASSELEDVESGARHAVTLDPDTLARYGELLAAHEERLQAAAIRQGASWASLVSDVPVDAFVTRDLVRLGLVRPR
jgi:uncharacterized protein (DUF58 family)